MRGLGRYGDIGRLCHALEARIWELLGSPLVVVSRGLDGARAEGFAIARGAQVAPSHFVRREGEKEVGRAVLGSHGHELLTTGGRHVSRAREASYEGKVRSCEGT